MIHIIAALVIVAFFTATHWKAYSLGKEACETAHQAAVVEQKDEDTEKAVDLVKADAQREIRYVEKRVTVEKIVDNCLDQRMPRELVNVLGGVQQRNGSGTPPGTPQALSETDAGRGDVPRPR